MTRTLLADLFGRAHHGSIQGTGMAAGVLATALFPLGFSLLRARSGGYALPLRVCCAISTGMAAINACWFRKPKPKGGA